ncbi:MAG: ABC transporter permease [Gammaproteobacteria bacterium]|nr:ABC transporter permease [Gammaproteobacteria bacterium]MCI0591026.1 ABC transporter permease [Gammaproteobacteria bacterium]
MYVLLWTDALIYLLVLVVIGFALYARRWEHLRAPWREVVQSRLGTGAAVVLFAYITIGLLDSVHFHPRLKGEDAQAAEPYSTEVISLFDVIVAPLREHVEKTYSAPFATHLYARETIELPDGREVREYPRLQYGGAHLQDPASDRIPDILHTSAIALVEALGVWLFCVVLVVGSLARLAGKTMQDRVRAIVSRRTVVPWDVILVTSGMLIACTFLVAHLGVKYHMLGTDKVGEDVFYQALKSIRTGLVIGTLTTLVMLPFAILLGIMAGYFRGWVDDAVQYVYTTLNSIPGVLLIAAAILMMQVYMANHEDSFTSLESRADIRLLFLCIILGITSWTGLCRLLRGEALKLRDIDYIQAAHSFGVGHFSIITRHILPNVMHIVLITVVLDFSALVLAEAVLSYINIGVDPTMESWGNMINSARLELARDPIVWWSLTAAFIFMFGLVLSANLFSDAVRDAFDPRLRMART